MVITIIGMRTIFMHKTYEEIKKDAIKYTLDELETVRNLLNNFEKDLSSNEESVPENAEIAIKTMYLFCSNKGGFETWFTEIKNSIIEKIKENKKQTRH